MFCGIKVPVCGMAKKGSMKVYVDFHSAIEDNKGKETPCVQRYSSKTGPIVAYFEFRGRV